MDFHFVPNLTWGPAFVNAIRKATRKPLFVHLMVDYPERYFERFELKSGDVLSVHWECTSEETIQDLLRKINMLGLKSSIALNPKTPVDVLNRLDISADNVLLMSVEPGFSGQEFLETTWTRLTALVELQKKRNNSFSITVDGGINAYNFHRLVKLGANQLAVASAIFGHKDRLAAIITLLRD